MNPIDEYTHSIDPGANVWLCGQPLRGRRGHHSDVEPTCPGCRTEREARALREALPYEPLGLRALIESLTYKPGWEFFIQLFREDGEVRGWRFHVISDTEDSMNPARRMRVNHAFPIPPASWKRDTWAAWLFDRVRDVETHEAGEFFRLNGYREFAPHHGNGEDPYRVWHVSDHETARKRAGDD